MKHDNDNNTGLRFLSVCSGIEAASQAWKSLDWQAVAFSEIEKFPSAVLAHRYPDVPNLGDFTKIDTRRLGRVDILAGGTPCQAFSVAGLRQSLADARGNLSLQFVRLAHELADGNGLRNVVWENVVGVLSTKDNAFGCFLAGLVGADAPIEPPARGKWPRHGMVSGPKGRAAWAVKNAEFFGVAQRRRRVLVVADFGNGADPAAVLFEPEGVFRHPPSRGEAGQSITHPVAPSLVSSGRGIERTGDTRGQDPVVAVYTPEIARCDATREGSSQDYETTTMVAVEVAPTMRAGGNKTGGDRPYGTDVDTCDSLAVVAFGWQNSASQGDGVSEHIVPTLDKSKTPAVVIPFDTTQITSALNRSVPKAGDPCHPLSAGAHPPAITVAIRGRDGGATAELGGEVATALRASQGGGDKPHVLTGVSVDLQNVALGGEVSGTLDTTRPGRGGGQAVLTSAVRRLTPTECERLQGFPDCYTDIPWRGKPTSPDGPRYKALGNSWAVPKFAWLGERIQRLMPNEKPAAANDNDGIRDEKMAAEKYYEKAS
jgi:DNA (cytosine-5)-methyltransferase 1